MEDKSFIDWSLREVMHHCKNIGDCKHCFFADNTMPNSCAFEVSPMNWDFSRCRSPLARLLNVKDDQEWTYSGIKGRFRIHNGVRQTREKDGV